MAFLNRLSGAWLVFLGALCWSTAGAVVKSFDTDPLLLAGVRSLLGGLVLSFAIRPKKIQFDKWLLFTILFYAGMVATVMACFRLTTAIMVIGMQYTAPIWIFLFGWLVSKKAQLLRALPLLLIVAAVLIFLLEPSNQAGGWSNLLALAMGVLFAGLSVSMQRVRHDNALGLVALMNLGAAVILLPLCFVVPGVRFHVGSSDWLYILYLAVFELSGGYFFYILGLKKVSPQKGTLLAAWELVLTPVWAFLAVREMPSLLAFSGMLLILAALLLDNRLDTRVEKELGV